jgi:hypothetical protein
VHTAGCVQVGWVDSAYDGGADIGQGVGDDAHSWAYDGWRMYLWHEVSSEWGAKWSPGDVVGCAVDLDIHTMSFYLNGQGVNVDMGLAFTDIEFSGGLYPCASFNRGEMIQFNFGSSPFAFSPPPGYLPYAKHVHAAMSGSREIHKGISKRLRHLCNVSSTTKQDGEKRGGKENDGGQGGFSALDLSNLDNTDTPGVGAYFFEDSIEEVKGERGARYFPEELPSHPRSGALAERPLKFPAAILPPRIPKDRLGLLKHIKEVCNDLCILYCRLSVFLIVRAFPTLKDKKAPFLHLLMAPTSASAETAKEVFGEGVPMDQGDNYVEEGISCMDNVLTIIRQNCASTQRTKIYLQTMALLYSESHLPQNIGSVYCAGGAPMLEQLRDSMSEMLSMTRVPSTVADSDFGELADRLLDQIRLDTTNVIRRDLASDWHLDGGFAPLIVKDKTMSDTACLSLPSLSLAVFMSQLLIKLVAYFISLHFLILYFHVIPLFP